MSPNPHPPNAESIRELIFALTGRPLETVDGEIAEFVEGYASSYAASQNLQLPIRDGELGLARAVLAGETKG